jgi:predicted RNA binding protein YcfA (HicA-like mRNA interferase family)
MHNCSIQSEVIAKSSRKIIKELQTAGWVLDRIEGSHHHFRHPGKPGTVTVPHPKKDLVKATEKSIRKQAEL